jgi:hypothetical protein
MDYFISYPRSEFTAKIELILIFCLLVSNKPSKLINQTCTVLSGEYDSTRGLYCPSGICSCELQNLPVYL